MSALPTLSFQHTFTDGLIVTLRVERDTEHCPKMICSHVKFQTKKIEKEYRQWSAMIGRKLTGEGLLTEDELIMLALSTLGL